MHGADKTLLAIFQWPPGATDEGKAQAMAGITGLDIHQTRLLVKKSSPPQVFCVDDPERAAAAARKLTRSGVDVVAASASDIGSHACRDLAKRFIAGRDASGLTWLAELWGGQPRVIRAADVLVMVRARFRVGAGSEFKVNSMALNAGARVGGVRVSGIDNADPLVSTAKKTRIAEILDIHLVGEPPIRVHGDKFSFDVLGGGKGITDSENMDLLATHFVTAAPRAAIDVSFKGFKPAAEGVRAFHVAAGRRGDPRVQVPVEFEFYSAWMAIRSLHQLGS